MKFVNYKLYYSYHIPSSQISLRKVNSVFYQEFYKFFNEAYQGRINLSSKFPLKIQKIYVHLQEYSHLIMGNELLFKVH